MYIRRLRASLAMMLIGSGACSLGPYSASTATPRFDQEARSPKSVESRNAQSRRRRFRPVPSDGFSGGFHQQHGHHIVFDTTAIGLDPASGFESRANFSLDQRIFMRHFITGSLEDVLDGAGVRCQSERQRVVLVQVNDGAPIVLEFIEYGEREFQTKTTFPTDSEDASPLNEGPLFFPRDRADGRYRFATELVPLLQPGANRVHVTLNAHCHGRGSNGWNIYDIEAATGDFTIEVEEGDIEASIQRVGPFLERSPNRRNRRLLPAVEATVEREWPQESFRGGTVTSQSWNVRRHPVRNTPIDRSIEAVVVVQREGQETCRAYLQSFTQQAEGRGFSDHMAMMTGRTSPFPCVHAASPRRP